MATRLSNILSTQEAYVVRFRLLEVRILEAGPNLALWRCEAPTSQDQMFCTERSGVARLKAAITHLPDRASLVLAVNLLPASASMKAAKLQSRSLRSVTHAFFQVLSALEVLTAASSAFCPFALLLPPFP